MANNRMYLRCRGCGAEIMLGKIVLGYEWYFPLGEKEKGEELQKFLLDHSKCCLDLEIDTCGGISPYDSMSFEPFELTYEMRDEYGNEKTLQQLDRELHPEKYEK